MSQRRSRLQRKAARVVKSEADREFDSELGALRRELNEALFAANETHRKASVELLQVRTAARADAYKALDEKRAELLKRLTATEAQPRRRARRAKKEPVKA